MKITYDEATDIIYSELRNCENSIAKKLGLKEVDVDIIGAYGYKIHGNIIDDYGYKIHGHIIDVCDLEVED